MAAQIRVGVTSGRKGTELADALSRRGMQPVLGPTVGGDRPEPDAVIIEQTDGLLEARPAWLAASTGVGMRLWAEVAERHGRREALRETLGHARRLARGAKAVGGLKGAFGLDPEWVAERETDAEVAARLVEQVQPGQPVAVQLHGGPSSVYDVVTGAGATLLTVLPYQSVLPDDTGPARELVEQVLDGRIDLLVFTSPGAVHNLMTIAGQVDGVASARLRRAAGRDVAVAAVGPVTAGARQDGQDRARARPGGVKWHRRPVPAQPHRGRRRRAHPRVDRQQRPSVDSSSHVVGSIFDTVVKEGIVLARDNPGRWGAQALDLAPAQGGYVEFELADDGLYPFVTHAFNHVGAGALGLFQAGDGGPDPGGGH